MDPLVADLMHGWHRAKEIRNPRLRAMYQYAISMWMVDYGHDTANLWLHRADDAFDRLAAIWPSREVQPAN